MCSLSTIREKCVESKDILDFQIHCKAPWCIFMSLNDHVMSRDSMQLQKFKLLYDVSVNTQEYMLCFNHIHLCHVMKQRGRSTAW